MTDRMSLGFTINPTHADLDTLWQLASNGEQNALVGIAAAAAAQAAADQANATVPDPAMGRTVATLQDFLNHLPGLNAADYGVVGDGVADDTAAMQAALTAGKTYKRVVNGGALRVKITGPLTMEGPGLVFENCAYGNAGESGIYPSGSGYVALTVYNDPTQMRFSVIGSGNACDGVLFQNAILAQGQKIRVAKLAGFGVRMNKVWDCTFNDLSIEQCGTATKYAFGMYPDGDTCNMTHIGRLQVEKASQLAIFVDVSTLSCVFDNIHSEQATVTSAGTNTWQLGGARCVYHAARLSSNSGANGEVRLVGGENTYTDLATEGTIPVQAEGIAAGLTHTLVTPNIAGSFKLTTNQLGRAVVVGGKIATVATNAVTTNGSKVALACYGVGITSLTVGDCENPPVPNGLLFTGCAIGVLASSSTNAAATFRDCHVASVSSLPGYVCVFDGGSVVGNCPVVATLIARGCVITGNTSAAAGATILGFGARFVGNLSQATACSSVFDHGCVCTGTVTGLGVPTAQPHGTAGLGSVWSVGQRAHNLTPAAGGAPGWVCTTAGGSGAFVFKAEANLAP